MLFLKSQIIFTIVIIKSNADDIVSEEKTDQNGRKDKNTYLNVERRFFDNFDDETWHVSHLKDTDFSARRSDCAEDTFEEKVKKYRKSLQNDGALVEYVSSDALPFNESDLVLDVCKVPDKKDIFQIALEDNDKTDAPLQVATTIQSKIEETEVKTATEVVAVVKGDVGGQEEKEKLNIATTTTDKNKESYVKPPNARKSSQYQFSSIEYYDETVDFDASLCPDAVEVITLEIEHIRNYDVRCEQILEWRSLE